MRHRPQPQRRRGRVAALEIMTGIPAIKNLIREGKTHQVYSVVETSTRDGMITTGQFRER